MGGTTLSTREDTTAPQLPDRRPTEQPLATVPASEPVPESDPGAEPAAAAVGGPTAAPDGTFTTAAPGGTQLVPATPAMPAPASSAVVGQQAGDDLRQGPVRTVPRNERPRAEDIIRPREKVEREQISAMVPAELDLVRRMRLLWAHEGIEQRDLVAFAVDHELRARGY